MDELITKSGYNESKGLKVDTPKGARSVSHTLKTRRSVVKVTTRNGYFVECTPEEPLLVFTKSLGYRWVCANKLNIGDFIVSKTNDNAPMFGTHPVTLNQATIMGYMTANGYRSELSSGDRKVVRRFRKLILEETGKYPYQHGEYIKGVCVPSWYFSKTYRREILVPLGYNPTSSYDKCIPISIRQAPREVLHEFLESYFECDCGINGGRVALHGRNDGIEIELCTASPLLGLQLHTILLQVYGIVARRYKTSYIPTSQIKRGGTRVVTYQVLTITGYDADLFLQYFKRAKAQKYRHRVIASEAGVGSDRRVVPYMRKYLSDVFESARAPVYSGIGKGISKNLITLSGERIKNDVRPRCFNGRSQAGNCLGTRAHIPEGLFYNDDWESILGRLAQINTDAYKKIRRILELRPHFEEVVSIEKQKGKVWVYDFTVPKEHCFTANGLVGHNTRFLAGIDELGWFFNGGVDDDEGREKASGREVHGALDRSLKTVRTKVEHRVARGYNNILSGYLLSLSSPSHARDMIMTLVNTHENSNDVLTVHLPTWKFNPDYTSRDDFSKEYREDFARAERDFAANPALNNNPFIAEEDAPQLQNCFTGQNRCNYEYKIVEKPGSDRKYKSIRIIGCSAVVQQPRTILAIDAGLTNNSFTLTVGTRQGRKMSFPVLIECAPVKGEEIINFNHIYENCIKPLIRAFNVVTVLADRWQSIKILQDIEEDFGIEVIQYSLRYGDFVEAKSYLLLDEPLVELPKPEMHFDDIGNHSATNYPHCFNRKPAAHLYLQFLTVKEIGRTVDKGDGLTDDVFRSFMLALTHLIDENFSQRLIGGVERGAGGIAVVGSKTGAAMGATPNNRIGTMSSRK